MAKYRSFLYGDSEVTNDTIILDKRESHHLVKVFRARAGETIEILDGSGRRYMGRLDKPDARGAVVRVDQVEVVDPPQPRVRLLQALPKTKAMDLILRMASEIGVSELQPLYTAHSEVSIPEDRVAGKVEKWRGTTIEACKQCGLAFLPELAPPMGFGTWLSQHPPAEDELRLVASLEEGARRLIDTIPRADLPKRIVLAVGPEGDFSPEEYAALRANAFVPVRLGENVLRAETATAYMLSVIDQLIQ